MALTGARYENPYIKSQDIKLINIEIIQFAPGAVGLLRWPDGA